MKLNKGSFIAVGIFWLVAGLLLSLEVFQTAGIVCLSVGWGIDDA